MLGWWIADCKSGWSMYFWLRLNIYIFWIWFVTRWIACFLYNCWLVCCLSVSLLSGWMLWWMTCLFVGHWLFSYGWWGCWIAWLVGGWRACLVEATWREFCLASILHSTPQIGHTFTKFHFLFGNWHSFSYNISSFFCRPYFMNDNVCPMAFYKVSYI